MVKIRSLVQESYDINKTVNDKPKLPVRRTLMKRDQITGPFTGEDN